MKGQDKTPEKLNGDRQPFRKRIQNNNSEDNLGSQKKNGEDARNVYQRPTRCPAELFQILMMLFKCCTQYASKFGKLRSGHGTGQNQFSFQSQRKAMKRNVQTITIELFSHASKVMLKILQARLQWYMN